MIRDHIQEKLSPPAMDVQDSFSALSSLSQFEHIFVFGTTAPSGSWPPHS